MHLTLALGVIVLQHVDLYSSRSTSNALDVPPLKSTEHTTDSYELEDGNIPDLVQRFFKRTSPEVEDGDQMWKNSPHRNKNNTKIKLQIKRQLRRTNKGKEATVPLTIIVANLAELAELAELAKLEQSRDKQNKENNLFKLIADKQFSKTQEDLLTQSTKESEEMIDGEGNILNENIKIYNRNKIVTDVDIDKDVEAVNKLEESVPASSNSAEYRLGEDRVPGKLLKYDSNNNENIHSQSKEIAIVQYRTSEHTLRENTELLQSPETSEETFARDFKVQNIELADKVESSQHMHNAANVSEHLTISFEDIQHSKEVPNLDREDLINQLLNERNISKTTKENEDAIPVSDSSIRELIEDFDVAGQLCRKSGADNPPVTSKISQPDDRIKQNENFKDVRGNSDGRYRYNGKTYNLSFLFNR